MWNYRIRQPGHMRIALAKRSLRLCTLCEISLLGKHPQGLDSLDVRIGDVQVPEMG